MQEKNYYENFDFKSAEKFIREALKEDAGKGDITSDLLIPVNNDSIANIIFKDTGVIAGLELFKLVFNVIDARIKIKFYVNDRDYLKTGTVIGQISGKSRKLLLGERLSLNILQRLSGIATSVHNFRKRLNNDSIKILDTRKTTPNFRAFEKLAVKIGGGENHRFGLYDMILIKDNHISANGGIEMTLKRLKKIKKKPELKIEIEVKNLNELKTVIKNGINIVNIVMLDNFTIGDVKKAVRLIDKKFKIEISGGINFNTINLYSGIKGIDFISSGSLTHSVKSADISLDFIS
jgi:nicotinate-nucleotide pyrophosphorylase (carboxylating)